MAPRQTFFGYARKSRIDPKNRKEVESTDRQIARLHAWAAAQGVELELFAEPDGYRSGGSIAHRPAYQEMLQRLHQARPGDVAGIVVTELDRTGRRERDLHELFDEIVERGLQLIVLDDPSLNLGSTDGRFIAGIKVLLAAQERRRTGDRMRRVMLDKRSRGLHVGPAPYGYRYAEVVSPETGHTTAMLEPDPVTAERLVAILHKYIAGAGLDPVARWCNAHGWPAPRGGPWSQASINELLRHVMVYRGYVLTRDERGNIAEMIVGRHAPLIDERLAQAVQAAKRDRAMLPRRGRTGKHLYPLVHLTWCAECGSHIVGSTRNTEHGKVIPHPVLFYRCMKNRGECGSTRMRARTLEAQVWADLYTFRDLLIAAATQGASLADIVDLRPPPEPAGANTIRAEMERLNRLYVKGRVSEAQYDRDYAALERKLATVVEPGVARKSDPLELVTVINHISDIERAVDEDDRAALCVRAREYIERVEVRDGVVVLVRLTPDLEVFRELLAELE